MTRESFLISYPVQFYEFGTGTPAPDAPNPRYFVLGFSAGLVHRTIRPSGFVQTDLIEESDLIIGSDGDRNFPEQLAPWQRCSHYRFTSAIGSKQGLHQVLNLLSAKVRHRFPFYPQSFLIPFQLQQFRAAAASPSVWI
jgi:hypothetical protein